MRLIDADALADKLGIKYDCADCEYECGPICTKGSEFVNACEAIFAAPIVDAVPVVRCKECKHRNVENGFCEGRGWPMQIVPDDGFCDKGERSEEWEFTSET